MKFFKKRLRWVTVSLSTALLLSSTAMMANDAGDPQVHSNVSQETQIDLESIKNKIPTTLRPGAILTYDAELEPSITYDTSAADYAGDSQGLISSEQAYEEVPDIKGRVAEDEFFKSVAESVKDLPVIDLGFDLPEPTPGTVVMYGSDGHINRVYVDEKIAQKQVVAVPSTTVPYPGRLPAGAYTCGSGQKIVISSGEGIE